MHSDKNNKTYGYIFFNMKIWLKLWIFLKTRKTPGFARLCSRSRFRFVGDPRIFFEKFVLSRFHGRYYLCRYIISADWQVAGKNSRWRWHLTAKTGEHYVIKRFDIKSRISPRNPDFSGFLLDQVTRGDLRVPKN